MAAGLLFGPLLPATLVDPHAADVLQEARGALNAALIGEVALEALPVDDGPARLDAHETPRARAEVGKLLVGRRHGRHGTGRIVTGHGHHRHGPESRGALHLGREPANHRGGGRHGPELVAPHPQAGHQLLVEVGRQGVEQLRSGGHRVLAHGPSREHIAQGIGDKEHFRGVAQGGVAVALHLIELEQRVEIHELDARLGVDRGLVHGLAEIGFHRRRRVGVAVSQRVAQYLAVVAHAYEVAAPGVDADAAQGNAAFGSQPQPLDNLVIEGKNVPVDMASGLDEHVVEARKLLQFEPSAGQCADDGAAACGPEVYGKIVFSIFHRELLLG